MKEKKAIILPEPPSINEQMAEHPIVRWAANHGRDLLLIAVIVILALILVYQFTSRSTAAVTQEYLAADKLVATLEQSPQLDSNALGQLMDIINTHPELHEKYDGLLAQILLLRGEEAKAAELINRSFKRVTDSSLPYYADFSKTTLLISQEQYEQALSKAHALQEQMIQNPSEQKFGDFLFAYNLLRIGMLQQQLGQKDQAQATWAQWGRFLNAEEKLEGVDPSSFQVVLRLFESGNINFKNYMEAVRDSYKA